MHKVQKGFTLIELVVVIVLLGILGVTALAKFQDLSTEAQAAANAGVAAEMSSGSSINYGAYKLGTSGAISITSTGTCAAAAGLFAAGALPTGYVVAANNCAGADQVTTCSVTKTGSSASAGLASVICTN
jgi:prepilin-type N-terminal cleavage/methylation domain-containing protein